MQQKQGRNRHRIILWSLLLALAPAGCVHKSPKQAKDSSAPEVLAPIDRNGPIGGNRPVEVKTPESYDAEGATKHPLLILLHGYGSDAARQDEYLRLSAAALQRGFVFAAPDGTSSPLSRLRFWNAGKACCNFEFVQVDDVVYVRDLIRQITARYAVDPARVYIFGHSNGGFMAHRFACEQAAWVTAIASLAGSLQEDTAACKPERPVSVLAIHGTADQTIKYEGGRFSPISPSYSSAEVTIGRWATLNGCEGREDRKESKFRSLTASGNDETDVIAFDGCHKEGTTELWKIEGGTHIPAFDSDFIDRVLDFFEAQQR